MLTTTQRPKACASCGSSFLPFLPMARACSASCAMKMARAERLAREEAKKLERKQDKARKLALKRPIEWERDCLEIVQKIARLRDRHDGCISCHMGANYGGAWHGSHFRPAGNNAAVQLNLWNIHKACAQCNLFKGGNIGEYRPRLIQKIGLERVEWLESQTQAVKRNVPYLMRFKAVMGRRLRRMEKRTKGESP
jgi:hypothetical protein